MKKYLKLTSCVVAISVLACGCKSFTTNRIGTPLQTKMILNLKPNVTIQKQKVSATATAKAVFGIFSWGVDQTVEGETYNGQNNFSSFDFAINKAKAGATYNACRKAKADFLISPQYDITTKNYIVYKEVKCVVTGFPAKLLSVEVEK